MKGLIVIKDSLANKISYYHLLCFFASLPFDRFYSQLILISFAAHTLIHLKKEQFVYFDKRPVFYLSFAFVLTAVGALFARNLSNALQEIDKQLAILLIPIIMGLCRLDLAKYRERLTSGLVLSCTVSILYLYFDAFKIIAVKGLPLTSILSESFINHNFSSPIGIHATYLAMFAAFALIYVLSGFITTNSTSKKLVFLLPIVTLTLGIIQLCSKSVFIALLIAILIAPFYLFHGIERYKTLVLTAFIISAILIGIYKVPPLREHFYSEFSKDLKHAEVTGFTDPRLARWTAAISVIQRSPMIGYGSGSEASVLSDEYFNRKLYHSYLNKLNAHNQFLSFWIKFGLVGMVMYVSILVYGFRNAVNQNDLLFTTFLLLITMVSFSENILDVNKGIFFYSSFFSLFTLSIKRQTVAVEIKRVERQPEQSLATY